MTQSNSRLSLPRHALTRTTPMTPTLPPIVPTALTTWGHALRLPMPILLTTSIRPSQAKKSTECHRHASTGGRGSRPGVNVSLLFSTAHHFLFTHTLLQASTSSCRHILVKHVNKITSPLSLASSNWLVPYLTSAVLFNSSAHSLIPSQPRWFLASPTCGGGRIRKTTGTQLDGLRINASHTGTTSAGACDARRNAVGTSVGRGVSSVWAWLSGSFGSSLLLVWWCGYCCGRGSFTGGESAYQVLGQFCFYH